MNNEKGKEMKHTMRIAKSMMPILAMLIFAMPASAQMYFEKQVFGELAILENPPESIMAKVTTTKTKPSSLQTTNFESDVKVDEVLEVAHAKDDKTIAYGSIVRITGKAFVAVYGGIDIAPDGSVNTGDQRIEKVGQPTTRLDISAIKGELYYAGKFWKPTSDESFILCTSNGITGVNVSMKDSPLKSKCLREKKDEP